MTLSAFPGGSRSVLLFSCYLLASPCWAHRWLFMGALLILSLPAASPPRGMVTRPHCCPTARCSSQAVATAAAFLPAERTTVGRAETGVRAADWPARDGVKR